MSTLRYRIRHTTRYAYSDPVAVSHNLARLAPRDDGRQRRTAWRLEIAPQPSRHRRGSDPFGNQIDRFVIQDPHRELAVTAESEVEVTPRPAPGADVPWDAPGAHPLAAEPFRYESPLVPRSRALAEFARSDFAPGRGIIDAALALTRRIHAGFAYDPAATTIATPVHEVLERRRGVCQDFAQLLCGCLRSLDLPARYVSGYLETAPPPGAPRLVGADASHAWVQLWTGAAAGWLDLDPTNGCIPDTGHIVVAWGRDFSDVSPLLGMILGGGSARIQVGVDVERLTAR